MRILTALILMITGSMLSHAQSGYLDKVGVADSLMSINDWEGAEKLLVEAIEAEPSNPLNAMLLSNLGMARFNAGKDSLAIVALSRAHELAPESVTVLSNRARVYGATGHPLEAYRDFESIIALDSLLTEPLFYHGMIALSLGLHEQAAIDFDRLEALAPDAVDTHLAHATFYAEMDEPQKAVKEYTWLIENDPSPVYLAERALLYIKQDYLNEASSDIAEALRLAPDDGELYVIRAVLNKMRYRPEESKADVKRAQQLGISRDYLRRWNLL